MSDGVLSQGEIDSLLEIASQPSDPPATIAAPFAPERERILKKFGDVITARDKGFDPEDASSLAEVNALLPRLDADEGAYLDSVAELPGDPRAAEEHRAIQLAKLLGGAIQARLRMEAQARQEVAARQVRLPLQFRQAEGDDVGALHFGGLCVGTARALPGGGLTLQNAPTVASADDAQLRELVHRMKFGARIVVASGRISVARLEHVASGDLLRTSRLAGEPLEVRVGSHLLASCEICYDESDVIVARVTGLPATEAAAAVASEPLDDAPSIGFEMVLASMQLSLYEVAGIGEGSCIGTDSTIRDPVRIVFENGTVLLGEIVVVNQWFGCRIIEVSSGNGPVAAAVGSPATQPASASAAVAGSEAPDQRETDRPAQEAAGLPADAGPRAANIDTDGVLATLRDRVDQDPEAVLASLLALAAVDTVALGPDPSGGRLAASLLLALGDAAATILRAADDESLRALSLEVARVEVASAEDIAAACALYEALRTGRLARGGIERVRDLLVRARGTQEAIDTINAMTASISRGPFAAFADTPASALTELLADEHAQTIALVFSYLEPGRAASVLANLPHQIQADVALRLATLRPVSPDVVREVERVLEARLPFVSVASEGAGETTGGIGVVAEVLRHTDAGTEATVVEALDEEAPEVAAEIRRRLG